jgi:hypothetical protein
MQKTAVPSALTEQYEGDWHTGHGLRLLHRTQVVGS